MGGLLDHSEHKKWISALINYFYVINSLLLFNLLFKLLSVIVLIKKIAKWH